MSNEKILKSKIPNYETPLKSVPEILLERLNERNGDSICFIDARIEEFLSQVNSLAVALIDRGINKSDRICCSSTNTISNAIIKFAAYFLGVTLIPLSSTFTSYELKTELNNSGSTVIFTSLKSAPDFESIVFDSNQNLSNEKIKLIVVFDGNYGNFLSFDELSKEGKNRRLEKVPHFAVDPKTDDFIMIYSSGTTGLPKCAVYKHFMIVSILTETTQIKPFDLMPNGMIVSGHWPLGHVSGTFFLILALYVGNTLVLQGEYDEDFILKSVEKYRISLFPLFPAFAWKLLEEECINKYNLSTIKLMATGGAPIPKHVVKGIMDKYGVHIAFGYGMTEYFPISSTLTKNSIEYIPGNVGFISANTELKIVDINTRQSLGPNLKGEICLRGPKMFSGYLNNDIATNETIDKEGWLHTGDLGHYDENERLFITDRLKEVIKIGVVTISPVEIEQFLSSHVSVGEVAVVGVKHRTNTQSPRAFVKLKEGKKASEEELQKFVADSMAYTKQLTAGVVFVEQIQVTSMGKIDRKFYKNLVKNDIIG